MLYKNVRRLFSLHRIYLWSALPNFLCALPYPTGTNCSFITETLKRTHLHTVKTCIKFEPEESNELILICAIFWVILGNILSCILGVSANHGSFEKNFKAPNKAVESALEVQWVLFLNWDGGAWLGETHWSTHLSRGLCYGRETLRLVLHWRNRIYLEICL